MAEKIQTIEQKLSTARTELADAQRKHANAVAREKELSEKRQPLLRAAKIQENAKAGIALEKLTLERFGAAQDVEDLRTTIQDIERDILALENEYEAAQQDRKVETLRGLMLERGKVGEAIENQVNALSKSIAEYIAHADRIGGLINELALPNGSTRALLGVPMLRDFIRNRLKFVFPDVSSTQRESLAELERGAAQLLEATIDLNSRRAA